MVCLFQVVIKWKKNTFLAKFERLTIVNIILKESRKEEDKHETKVEDANKEVEICREALEAAEKRASDELDELNEKKKWRRTVQKRAFFLANETMKEDNSDLGIIYDLINQR